MIDYIDRRDNSVGAKTLHPHLPWSDNRAFWQNKPVQPYTKGELRRLAVEAEEQAKNHLNTFKVNQTWRVFSGV